MRVRMSKGEAVSQQRLKGSPQKTKQQIAHRESRPDSIRSFHGRLHPILQLHRTAGNRRVAQLIQAKRLTPDGKIIGVQPKLTVGPADDGYEREADRVARQVMTIPNAVVPNSMQRAMLPEEDKERALQTKVLTTLITLGARRLIRQYDEEEKPIQTKSAESPSCSFEKNRSWEQADGINGPRGHSPLSEKASPRTYRASYQPTTMTSHHLI